MKYIYLSLATLLLIPTAVSAQHSDIAFTYQDDTIILIPDDDGCTAGLQIFSGTFPTSGFSTRFTENPGFLAEGMNSVVAGDGIQIELLQNSSTGTYLTYYDPVADAIAPTDANITIDDNMGDNTADLVISNLDLSKLFEITKGAH